MAFIKTERCRKCGEEYRACFSNNRCVNELCPACRGDVDLRLKEEILLINCQINLGSDMLEIMNKTIKRIGLDKSIKDRLQKRCER